MAQILRVSIGGSMPGNEEWTTNPCWEINGSAGAPVSSATALTIATAISAIVPQTGLLSMMAPGTTIASFRVEARQLTGALESQAEFARSAPFNGTGTNTHPHQIAAVLSLLTPGVGPSARGRLYWPATGQNVGSTDYRLTASNQNTLLTSLRSYLTGIEAAIKVSLPEANLTVWSRKTANFHDVNSIRLGNVLDVQRRRRDTLIENYQALPYPS